MAGPRRLALASYGGRRQKTKRRYSEKPGAAASLTLTSRYGLYGLMVSCSHVRGLLRKAGLSVWHNELSINYLY